MADELNQPDSSQPSTTEGTNGAGKPAEASSSTMTPSQQSDYYNKTQQLAQERRELEAQRQAFEQQRQQFQQQYPQTGYGQPQPQGYQPNGYAPPQFQMPVQQATYADLVKEFGVEGANAQLRLLQQVNEPVLQQFAQAKQELDFVKFQALQQNIQARGKELYGKEWAEKEKAVLDHIVQTGHDLEYAWYKVNGLKSINQAAIDQAYQTQQQKEQGNVSTQGIQPSGGSPSEFRNVGDAFDAAWKQHAG